MANQNGAIVIEVTQEDIDAGVRGDPHLCPIARAMQRRFPDEYVRVSSYVDLGSRFTYLPTPSVKFIEAFDDGKPVEPITVTLPAYSDWRIS